MNKQLRKQYDVESRLAERLLHASPEERAGLYSHVYDEFYRLFPSEAIGSEANAREVYRQMIFLHRFLEDHFTFLEIGPGNCRFSFDVAPLVKKVYVLDVSKVVTGRKKYPENFELIISDGRCVPLKEGTVNIAYSHQLMEHLHPDDALEQLRDIHRVLARGSMYVCVTPNRINGPHDVSKYFDKVATGLHLKEYTTGELIRLFKIVGFAKVRAYCGARDIYLSVPTIVIKLVEWFLSALPLFLRRPLANSLPARILLGIRLIGIK